MPKRCTTHWLWWTLTKTLWSDFWVMDDFGNLTRVHLSQAIISQGRPRYDYD